MSEETDYRTAYLADVDFVEFKSGKSVKGMPDSRPQLAAASARCHKASKQSYKRV